MLLLDTVIVAPMELAWESPPTVSVTSSVSSLTDAALTSMIFAQVFIQLNLLCIVIVHNCSI